jgi:putative thioredoxin
MIDITLENLQTELVEASMQQPVLLDIWAPWCGPCKSLGPVLERLEAAYGGRFLLTKLNSDDQPEIAAQLSQAFGVRSIPFCVMFSQGQPVDGFVGAIPEAQIREFLDKHVPTEDALLAEAEVEAAEELLEAGADPALAMEKLQEALEVDPNNAEARFELLKLLLERALADPAAWAQAQRVFEPLASRALSDARVAAFDHWLKAVKTALSARPMAVLDAAIATMKRDFEARFERAQCLFASGQRTLALDELLEILMRDKSWNQELARKTYVGILELMRQPLPKATAESTGSKGTLELAGKAIVSPSDPLLDQYRRKLSMTLF